MFIISIYSHTLFSIQNLFGTTLFHAFILSLSPHFSHTHVSMNNVPNLIYVLQQNYHSEFKWHTIFTFDGKIQNFQTNTNSKSAFRNAIYSITYYSYIQSKCKLKKVKCSNWLHPSIQNHHHYSFDICRIHACLSCLFLLPQRKSKYFSESEWCYYPIEKKSRSIYGAYFSSSLSFRSLSVWTVSKIEAIV